MSKNALNSFGWINKDEQEEENKIVNTGIEYNPFSVNQETVEPVIKNSLLQNSVVDTPPVVNTDFEQYWGQPVGSKKFNVPLDRFVQLAGMAAHAINPTETSGILGKDLSQMGGEAYNERIKRERETPNELLRQQIAKAHLTKLREEVPEPWDIYYRDKTAQGYDGPETLKMYIRDTNKTSNNKLHFTETETGEVSAWGIDSDGNPKLLFGPGKGKDTTNKYNGFTDDSGNVTIVNLATGNTVKKIKGIGKTKESTAEREEAKTAGAIKRNEAGVGTKGAWKYVLNKNGIPVALSSKGAPPQIMDAATNTWRNATTEEVSGFTSPSKPLSELDKTLKEARESKSTGKPVGKYKKATFKNSETGLAISGYIDDKGSKYDLNYKLLE